jgi:hypothetical protein
MVKRADRIDKRLAALSARAAAVDADLAPAEKKVKRRGAREAERKAAYRFARLVLPNGSDICCIVRDVSATGARVMMEGQFALPQDFTFRNEQTGKSVKAHLVWQDGAEVGIAFDPA